MGEDLINEVNLQGKQIERGGDLDDQEIAGF